MLITYKDISPDKDPKYSLPLFKYIKRFPNYNKVLLVPKEKEWASSTLLFYNDDNNFIGGRFLSSILLSDSGYLQCNFSYYNVVGTDISDEFWGAYLRKGSCIFDHNHVRTVGVGKNRFSYVSPTERVCNWCGLTQNLIETEKVVIHKVSTWENRHE
jgi:hypothetical protein